LFWHNSYDFVTFFQAMPDCITFRDAPLEHEEHMQIMFDAIRVTNETSFVPSTGGGVDQGDGAGGGDDNIEE
jgi:hypothetical protein